MLVEEIAGGVRGAAVARLHHAGPAANLAELKGTGRIYLAQLGEHKLPYSVDDFSAWLRRKYGLDVQLLPATGLDHAAWDPSRKQYIAELLFEQLKREHPDLAADPNAYLFGFTDADMYSVNEDWNSTFTQRDHHRIAVISAIGVQDRWWERAFGHQERAQQNLQTRLRRILLKDVALLYWKLPQNMDSTSLLSQPLDVDLPSEDIYQSDLQPARSGSGQIEGEPCLFFAYSAKDGTRPLPGPQIRACSDLPEDDESVELIEVDLRFGLLIDKHTDFDLPGPIPIKFQRAIRDGWSSPNPFGISGTDNYDEYLWSRDNIQISVIHNDGGRDELMRSPRWLPVLSLVKYVDRDYSGKFYEMRYSTAPFEHYDLKRFDGAVETFLPCAGSRQYCYLTGYKDTQGRVLKFERDESRKLIRLTSPNQSWLRFTYGPKNRISEINDILGRKVTYGYDERNRLISIAYPSGEVLHYEYDDQQHLLSFSAAPDAKTPPRLLVRNEYVNGRVVKQTFADGNVYTYDYYPVIGDQIRVITVSVPGGAQYYVQLTADGSILRESR